MLRSSVVRSRRVRWPLIGLLLGLLIAGGVLEQRADGAATEVPSTSELTRRATAQGFTPWRLLGNDSIGAAGARVAIARVERAWQFAKDAYYGDPASKTRVAALHEVYVRWERRQLQMEGIDKTTALSRASIQLRLMGPTVKWPGESDRQQRSRVAATLVLDKERSKNFWKEVEAANDAEPSQTVKAICGIAQFGPEILAALTKSQPKDRGDAGSQSLREACEKVGRKVQHAAEDVAEAVKDPLGVLAKGLFGDMIGETAKGVSWMCRQVGTMMDRTLTIDLGAPWFLSMMQRAAAVAMVVGLIAFLLGLLQSTLEGFSDVPQVVVRAMTTGVAVGALLSILTLASTVVQELTSILIGSGKTGKNMAAFADHATAILAEKDVPSIVVLLLLLALLVGMLLVWGELLVREPLLYFLAFWYGPVRGMSAFKPARKTLSRIHGLLAAVVAMPLIVIGSMVMAAEWMAAADGVGDVLQSVLAVFVAAGLPTLLFMVAEPGVGYGAGLLARNSAGAARRGAGAATGGAGGAAAFAKARLDQARSMGHSAGGEGVGGVGGGVFGGIGWGKGNDRGGSSSGGGAPGGGDGGAGSRRDGGSVPGDGSAGGGEVARTRAAGGGSAEPKPGDGAPGGGSTGGAVPVAAGAPSGDADGGAATAPGGAPGDGFGTAGRAGGTSASGGASTDAGSTGAATRVGGSASGGSSTGPGGATSRPGSGSRRGGAGGASAAQGAATTSPQGGGVRMPAAAGGGAAGGPSAAPRTAGPAGGSTAATGAVRSSGGAVPSPAASGGSSGSGSAPAPAPADSSATRAFGRPAGDASDAFGRPGGGDANSAYNAFGRPAGGAVPPSDLNDRD